MSTEIPGRGLGIEVNTHGASHHVDLASIVAGALLSTAVAVLFASFGSAVGLTMLSPYRGEGVSGTTFLAAIGLWTLWVAVSSTMAGGYLAGRLRKRTADVSDHEVEIRDGFHGLAVWAIATLLGAYIASISAVGAGKAMKDAAGTAVNAVAGSTNLDMSQLLGAPDSGTRIDTATSRLLRNPQNADPREVMTVLSRSAADGDLAADDRQYLIDLVAARTNRTPDEAGAMVDQAYAQIRQTIAEARDAAESARKMAVLVAFLTAASLLAAGVGAWWAATRGGVHRDQRTDFSRVTRWAD